MRRDAASAHGRGGRRPNPQVAWACTLFSSLAWGVARPKEQEKIAQILQIVEGELLASAYHGCELEASDRCQYAEIV